MLFPFFTKIINNYTVHVHALSGDAEPAFVINEEDVRSFSSVNERMAPGPDRTSPRTLKNCSAQLVGFLLQFLICLFDYGSLPELKKF